MSQLNLQIIAHNIANASTPGYSRQRAEMLTAPPLAYPSLSRGAFPQQVGTGVNVESIKRIRDEFLDQVIWTQNGSQGRNVSVEAALRQVELIYNEPGENTLGSFIDRFFGAWSELANSPELVSTRANIRENAISLSREFNRLTNSLEKLAIDNASQVRIRIKEANNLAWQIAGLNTQIAQVTNLGDNPNDLKDQRDLYIEELSDIIPLTTIEDVNGSLSILIGGLRMVEYNKVQELRVTNDPNDIENVSIEFTNHITPELYGRGKLAGLMEVIYEYIPRFHEKLNNLATAVINRVNLLHLDGFGLDGIKGRPFFTDLRTAEITGTFSLPTWATENTTLDELGISKGYFTIQGAKITITQDDIAPGEAIKIKDLLNRINNAQPFVRAIFHKDVGGNSFIRLDLYNPVEADTEINIFKGSSNFFQVVGLNGAPIDFLTANETYSSSSDMISLWSSILKDLDIIAAAEDDGSGIFTGPGNNGNALAIAGLQSLNNAIGGASINDYYSASISILGSLSQSTSRLVTSQGVLLEQLKVQRESVRGVNLDEEATMLITYQRIYEGAARVTNVVDLCLDTVINRMGI